MTTPLKLGALLQSARTARRLPKTRVAAQAGISRNTLQQLEAGLGNVELRTLLAVCDVLGLDLVLQPREIASKVQESLAGVAPRRPADDVAGSMPASFLSRLVRDKQAIARQGRARYPAGDATGDRKKDSE